MKPKMCISLMKIDFVLVMYMSKSMKVRIIFFRWKTREGELLFCFNTDQQRVVKSFSIYAFNICQKETLSINTIPLAN